ELEWKPGGRGKNFLVRLPQIQWDRLGARCVYLYKEGVDEPYVGKIVKIWGNEKLKVNKVKVQWFFHPKEIQYYLMGENVKEDELFLGSGKGLGVANVNPLEAIAGKCNVVCISKDSRNPQPSAEELSKADYVFYRTFDVDSFSISDKWGDHVGELEAKFVFNRINEISENLSLPHVVDDRNVGGCKVNCNHSRMGSSEDSESTAKDKFASPIDGARKTEDPVKEFEDVDNRPAKRTKLELQDNESKEINGISLERNTKVCSSKDSLVLAKDLQLDSKSNHNDVALSKKRKVDEDFEVGKTKFTMKFGDDSRSYVPSKSSSILKSSAIEKSKKLVVTRRPNVDKNTWFKDGPWEDRMLTAQEHGTLILLQNLDPEYTSGEVEDIIWHAFEEKCSAKMVQHTAISSPFSGKAFVIIRSKEVVGRVLKRLREDCLMLPNGRPLVGGRARLPKVSEKLANFDGHLSIDKLKHKVQRDMKEAVSTSHYSQPNTIEYEMAVDWFLLQARSTMWWKKLHKKQADEIEKHKANLKSKQNAN
ncbi:hypothetical protein Leryth_016297, partial [Lithospermum erythrorhizon]